MTLTTAAPPKNVIKVMVVDDSALMRKLLSQLLSRSSDIEIIDTAMDGQFALDHLKKVRPDVILMDIDMPRLDGLGALDRIVAEYNLPVVMCSARTTSGAQATMEALARGAVDFIEKPSLEALNSGEAAANIIARVRGALGAKVVVRRRPAQIPAPAVAAPSPISIPKIPIARSRVGAEQVRNLARNLKLEIVAIGTSTGGPPALEQVLGSLPENYPYGIVIVQHMPEGFTALMADHLNQSSRIQVREARDGEVVRPGVALVTPGNHHMRVIQSKGEYVVVLDAKGALVSGHRPSVDVLFESLAASARDRAVAVIMTGMGSDGAEGMGRLAEAGALTIAQAPESCVVGGMPKSAIDRGHVRAIVPLDDIGPSLAACAS